MKKALLELLLVFISLPLCAYAQGVYPNGNNISVEAASSAGTVSLITHTTTPIKAIVNNADAGGWSGNGTPLIASGRIETKAAAGNSQGTATALTATKSIHIVTGSDETTAVVLPACAAANVGEVHYLFNTVANKFLSIYPASGSAINALAGDAVYTCDATGVGRHLVTCVCVAAATWACG